MREVRFNDTTLRDGALSLWASNMTTGMILPVVEQLDQAGYESIEIVSSSFFKKAVRELKEDPWERIRLVAGRLKTTPMRMMTSRINTFNYDPPSMYRRYLELCAANGIREVRILDPWNEFSGLKRRVDVALDCGLVPVVCVTYSVSPRHTDEYFAERTRQAASLPAYRLSLKDPGGLLTPERARTLIPILLKNSNGIPVELHTHCTTGLGPLCCVEAIKLGIESVDTAVPPLANGSSNPSVFNVAANARALGYRPVIDEEVLKPVSDHFTSVARREGFPIGAPVEYDHSQFQHQVPGGMISNLRHQLRLVGLENRMQEALEETVRVRAELGYPIMVTPLSQFVGSQAAFNVIVGERYREVTDQVIEYALGRYGGEATTEMDPDVKDRILDRPRARDLASRVLPDPSLDEMRRAYGGAGVSDEEMVLRWLTSTEEVDAVRSGGPPQLYAPAGHPLLSLLDQMTRRADCDRIHVQKRGLSLSLEKRNATHALRSQNPEFRSQNLNPKFPSPF
jgi:oxaloacetate decarboxylase alpha subunit